MKRREFVTLVASGAVALPLSALAQKADPLRRIAVLVGTASEDRQPKARIAAFVQSLQELGWTNGRNVQIEYRWAAGSADNARKYASEFAARAPDVILASGSMSATYLLQATRTIPIVFVLVADPVGAGFVESLSKPGGNVTGFMQFEYSLAGKWLELLKQVAPDVTRAAVIRDPAIASGIG